MTKRPATPRKSRAKTLQGTLESSIKAATWLTPADDVTIQLARTLAKAIQEGETSPQLAARLLDTLKALGLTAVSRKDLGLEKKREEVSPLAEVRNLGAAGAPRIAAPPRLHAVPK